MNWTRELALLAVGQSALILFILLTLRVTNTSVARLRERWRLLLASALGLAAIQILFALGRYAIGWTATILLAVVMLGLLWAYSRATRRRRPPTAEQTRWMRQNSRAINWVTVAVLAYMAAASLAVGLLLR